MTPCVPWWPSAAFIAFLIFQRLAELAIARSNTARALRAGAREHGAAHYPLLVALHTAWLLAIAVFGFGRPVNVVWLTLFVLLQVLRVWVLATLGRLWTTRIIIWPGRPLVRRGPYRLLSHPNYAVVAAEIAVAPLVLGLGWVAASFSLLNAVVLTIRIRAENKALSRAT